MLKVATTAADVRLEAEGVWVEYKDGVDLKLARQGNPEFVKEYDKQRAPYRKQLKRDTLPSNIQLKMLCAVYARTVLLDWRGKIEDYEGNALKYTPKLGNDVLTYDKEFREFVTEQADDERHFRDEQIEKTAKKSKAG